MVGMRVRSMVDVDVGGNECVHQPRWASAPHIEGHIERHQSPEAGCSCVWRGGPQSPSCKRGGNGASRYKWSAQHSVRAGQALQSQLGCRQKSTVSG